MIIKIPVEQRDEEAAPEVDVHFFLVNFGTGYQVKMRPPGTYSSAKERWGREIHDIDDLVDSENYTIMDEAMFKMLYPSVDVNLVKVMLKEFEGRDYYAMYHGSQDNKFWKNPKKALAEMSPKYRKPYTLDACYEMIRKVI